MKFTREMTSAVTIQRVTPSCITVNGQPYEHSLALTPEEIIADWPPKPVAELADSDFHGLLETAPEIILLGTGANNVFPPRALMFAFARRGIGLEFMDTAAAARTFNVLANEGRQVAAVLYL